MPPPTVVVPPWIASIDPTAPVDRMLSGYRTGLSAGEAQSAAAARAQQMAIAQQQAAELNAYRQQQQALDAAQFNAKLRLDQDKAQREAQLAAAQLEGQRGIQEDLAAGLEWPQALAKWAPKLFAGEPRGLASAMDQITGPRPPVFSKGPGGVDIMQSPTGGAQVLPGWRADHVPRTMWAGEGDDRVQMVETSPGQWRPVREEKPEGMTEAQRQMFELRSLQSEFNQLSKVAGLAEDPNKVRKMTPAQLEKEPEYKPARKALDRIAEIEKEMSQLLGKPVEQETDQLPTVTTKAQFDALPSGSIYIGKDGRRYRKP